MNLPIITYTNSKCNDALLIYIKLLDDYYGKTHHTIITDNVCPNINSHHFTFIYSQNDPFYDVWLRLLPDFKSKYFIYMQEDFFLYKQVNKELLNYYVSLMDENDHLSCIRLIKSGINSNIPTGDVSTLYYVDYITDYAFSMQPTIWRTTDFIKLQKTKLQLTPWDEYKLSGNILIKLDLVSLYHYNGEQKRGTAHFDSDIFPYIATALVKGKWNTSEYPELKSILKHYNIDIKLRGEYK